MAKKKSDEPVDNKRMEAQLIGTISRVYGILHLESKTDSMLGRWEAVDEWCGRFSGGVRCIPVEHDKVLTHD